MTDIWDDVIDAAINKDTLLRTSELDVNMLVKRVGGDRLHRVIECLVAPDGFQSQGIVRTMDDKGYDQTYLYEVNGKNDTLSWILIGRLP